MTNLSDRLGVPRKPEPPARGTAVRAAAFLILALLAAGGAGILFKGYLEHRTVSAAVPVEKVVVAAADIPMATALRAEVLATVDWPRTHLPPGVLRDAKALVGKVVTVPVAKGELLLASKLADGEAGQGLSAVLPPAMRAVSVRVDDVVGVAGFIHPGDSVDVIVTMKERETSDVPPVSKVILQNVRVLAVGKELERKAKQLEKAVPVTVATLMVSGADSEKLALASTKGQILLALRSRSDTSTVETPGAVPAALLDGSGRRLPAPPRPTGLREERVADGRPRDAREPKEAVAAAAVQPEEEPPPEPHEVEILRGDLFEKRRFQKRGSNP